MPPTEWLKNKGLFSYSSRVRKAKIKVPIWLVSPGASLLGLHMDTVLLPLHMPSVWVHTPLVSFRVS